MRNQYRFNARPRATMRMRLLHEVRVREAVPGVGGVLGWRVSEGRGRLTVSFGFDTDWVDVERSDKGTARARARTAVVAKAGGRAMAATDRAEPDGASIEATRLRPLCVLPRHPRAGKVGAMGHRHR